MKAQELLKGLYRGAQIEPRSSVSGIKPKKPDLEMICDCDGGGECCGY